MVFKWRRKVADDVSRRLNQAADRRTTQRNYQRTKSNRPPAEDHDARFLAESARHNSSGLPSQGMGDMPLDHTLSGRMERRLPIIVAVRLAQSECASTDEGEHTYTDNISPRGARVYSNRPWRLGDGVQVAPRNEASACGKVVYCQMLPDDRYVIGVKFQDRPIQWSAITRYDGLQISPAKSKSS